MAAAMLDGKTLEEMEGVRVVVGWLRPVRDVTGRRTGQTSITA